MIAISTIKIFKISFLCGLILLFLSLFVEWYSFQIYTLDYELIVSWKYNIFKEWSTLLIPSSQLNEALRPENLSVPLPLNIIFLGSLILSGYIMLFKDVERVKSIANYRPYSYLLITSLILNLFYIIAFPIMYLTPQRLYFPFLQIVDYNTEFIYLYHFDIGYIFHLIAFMLIFPFTIFYFRTLNTFDNVEKTPETMVEKVLNHIQEPLDLDKLIAQEELKYKTNSQNSQEIELENIINSFIEGGD
ncbi:MAG: hypothetical protein ACFE9Q_11345 [Candidatus Hodarchaeota archaeon]